MVAGDHKFHPECFCCTSCGGFIGDGESYALVERSKLYWLVFSFIIIFICFIICTFCLKMDFCADFSNSLRFEMCLNLVNKMWLF